MGQIIKSVCVCQCICPSASTLTVTFFLSIFTKIGTDERTPKRKNEFVAGQYRTTPSPILSPKTPILGQEVLKTNSNIK